MRAFVLRGLALAISVGLGAAAPARALTINLTFDPTHPESSGAFSPAEQAVIQEAARSWSSWITSPGTVNVTAVRSGTPATLGLLGLAKDYQSSGGMQGGRHVGSPTGGTILLSDSAPWFVDPTPGEDSEYAAQVLSTVPGLPPSYLTAHSGGAAAGVFDLLSVASHEIGHVLGIASAYQSFAGAVQASPDTTQKVYVFGAAALLGDPAIDYLAGFFAQGGVYLPQSDENPAEAGSVGGVPSHFDQNNLGGKSAGLFPLDLMNPGIARGERRHVSFADLDVLADAFGLTVVPEPGTVWLLGLGLAGALVWRRGRARG